MKAKAYSYIRFSTQDQIHGDSLRRQTEAAAEWCRRNGVELVDSYRDLGVSAFKGKNADTGALSSFLALVRKGRICKGSYLIVESLDRVSRKEAMEAFDLFSDITKLGIVVVTLSDGQVYDREKLNANPMQLMISMMVMVRAHEESATKALRLGAAWDTKRKNIKTEKMTSKCVGWLTLSADRSRFELVPQRASIVRRIFDMASNGQGANGITKTLQREGVETFGRSKAWHVSYVKKILDNRAVLGEFAPATKRNGKRTFFDAIPDYYPPVVKRETFATVQQMRKARPSYRGRSSFNVFSHLAFDRTTNTPMVYVNKDRGKGWHYLVPAASLRQQAPYSAWQYDEFLSFFLLVTRKASLQKPREADPANGALDIARMELDDCEKKLKRLVDFLADGQSGAVETKLREVENRKAELQARVNELENESLARPAAVSEVNWKDSTKLRENLRATVRRITVDAASKSFQAQFLDGRAYTFSITKGEVTIETPDNPKTWTGAKILKHSRKDGGK